MTLTDTILETDFPDLKLIARGKVRDIYEIEGMLLFVATDRISAFDVILKNGIPGKGKILTGLSSFWFNLTRDIIPNHLITDNLEEMPKELQKYKSQLEGRCLLVKKLKIIPIEAIVRGYISGSLWNEYKQKGRFSSIELEGIYLESEKFSSPIFTPSTKAEVGKHDENITFDRACRLVGASLCEKIRETSIALYERASKFALEKGIIIADTKFEFGLSDDGELILVDEILTPDSSRFWPLSKYEVGRSQESFDKQFVRDYLISINFDKTNPVELPKEIISNTWEKYKLAYKLVTGKDFH